MHDMRERHIAHHEIAAQYLERRISSTLGIADVMQQQRTHHSVGSLLYACYRYTSAREKSQK